METICHPFTVSTSSTIFWKHKDLNAHETAIRCWCKGFSRINHAFSIQVTNSPSFKRYNGFNSYKIRILPTIIVKFFRKIRHVMLSLSQICCKRRLIDIVGFRFFYNTCTNQINYLCKRPSQLFNIYCLIFHWTMSLPSFKKCFQMDVSVDSNNLPKVLQTIFTDRPR